MAGELPDDLMPEGTPNTSEVPDDLVAEAPPVASSEPTSLLARTLAKLGSEGSAAGLGFEREARGVGNLLDRLPDVAIPGTSDADLQAFDAAHRDLLSQNRAGEVVGQGVPWLAAQALPGLDVAADATGAGRFLPLALRALRGFGGGGLEGYATAPSDSRSQGAGALLGAATGGAGEYISPALLSKAGSAVKAFLDSDLGKLAQVESGVGNIFLPLAQAGRGAAQAIYQKAMPSMLGAKAALTDQASALSENLPKVFKSAYNRILSKWAAPGELNPEAISSAVQQQVLAGAPDVPQSIVDALPNVVNRFVTQVSGSRGLTGPALQNAYTNLTTRNLRAALGDAANDVTPSFLNNILGSTKNVIRQVRRAGLSPEDAQQLDQLDSAYGAAPYLYKNKVKGNSLLRTGEMLEFLANPMAMLHISRPEVAGAALVNRMAATPLAQKFMQSSAFPLTMRAAGMLGVPYSQDEASDVEDQQ